MEKQISKIPQKMDLANYKATTDVVQSVDCLSVGQLSKEDCQPRKRGGPHTKNHGRPQVKGDPPSSKHGQLFGLHPIVQIDISSSKALIFRTNKQNSFESFSRDEKWREKSFDLQTSSFLLEGILFLNTLILNEL